MEMETTELRANNGAFLTVGIASGKPEGLEQDETLSRVEIRFVSPSHKRECGETFLDPDPETGRDVIRIVAPADPSHDIKAAGVCDANGHFSPAYSLPFAMRNALKRVPLAASRKVVFRLSSVDMAMLSVFSKLKVGCNLYLGESHKIQQPLTEILFLVEPTQDGHEDPRFAELLKAFGIARSGPALRSGGGKHSKNRGGRGHIKRCPAYQVPVL